MRPTNSLFQKLAYQLLPAAVVSALGIALLSSLARPVSAPPQATPGPTAVTAEAVFTPTPKPVMSAQPAEQPNTRATAKAKPQAPAMKVAAIELPAPPVAPAAPLQIAPPIVSEPAPAPAPVNPGVMGRLRGVTASVAGIPQRAYSKVTGWFAYDTPPRPPADIPAMKVSM